MAMEQEQHLELSFHQKELGHNPSQVIVDGQQGLLQQHSQHKYQVF